MPLPSLFHSNVSLLLYAMLIYILVVGLLQFIKARYLLQPGDSMIFRSLIPLGVAAAALRFVGLFVQYRESFAVIEVADIRPSIVAAALKDAFAYPILGLLTLSISCVFRFVNQLPLEGVRRKQRN